MVEANNIVINSETSSSAIMEVIPRDIRSSGIYLPSSLVRLSLEDCKLSNESFPMDMSSLFMLKELCLDGNDDIISMPNCVKTLPRLEILSIEHCARLTTIEHPPRTLKYLTFTIKDNKLGKVVFDQDMSPIKLGGRASEGPLIEGMYKVEDMGDVEEELLLSLGWTNLDFTKIQPVKKGSKVVQMLYEFGIFSIWYQGKEMPSWIRDRRWEGSSISFTIPSSPNNLRGLNICFMLSMVRTWRSPYIVADIKISNITKSQTWIHKNHDYIVADIKISNITKSQTWIHKNHELFNPTGEGLIIYLSHWMFGKNEMEDRDQITITIVNNRPYYKKKEASYDYSIMECGVNFVYDEDDDGKKKMEEGEDVLGYYKSWNHIIGGDLSPFQTTTPGEYDLDRWCFFVDRYSDDYVDKYPSFRAFRPNK